MYEKKNSSKKMFVAMLAIALLIGCTIGGTIAWLMDSTETVTNVFTVGNIQIDLQETVNGTVTSAKSADVKNNYFKIIPGTSQTKDPKVVVEAGSEACWVFIKVDVKNNDKPYVDYTINTANWTVLDASKYPGVYYHEQAAATEDVPLYILTGNEVSYPNTLTKADINALYDITTDSNGNTTMTVKDEASLPSMDFTAYAIQKTKDNNSTFTAEDAWKELNPANP